MSLRLCVAMLACTLLCGNGCTKREPDRAGLHSSPVAMAESELAALVSRVDSGEPLSAKETLFLEQQGAAALKLLLQQALGGHGAWARGIPDGSNFLGVAKVRGYLAPCTGILWRLFARGDNGAGRLLTCAGSAGWEGWASELDAVVARWRAVDVAWWYGGNDLRPLLLPILETLLGESGGVGDDSGRSGDREAMILAMLTAVTGSADIAALQERVKAILPWRREHLGTRPMRVPKLLREEEFLGESSFRLFLAYVGDGDSRSWIKELCGTAGTANIVPDRAWLADARGALKTFYWIDLATGGEWIRNPEKEIVWLLLEAIVQTMEKDVMGLITMYPARALAIGPTDVLPRAKKLLFACLSKVSAEDVERPLMELTSACFAQSELELLRELSLGPLQGSRELQRIVNSAR